MLECLVASAGASCVNGGTERHFDPLGPVFVEDPFFRGLLVWCARSFAQVSGHDGDWDIKVHPYRIVAAESASGHPTPEGMHRDGVDYILTMMVRRDNVIGGETTITDASGAPLWRRVLLAPLDIIIADDARTKHAVIPVEGITLRRFPGWGTLAAAGLSCFGAGLLALEHGYRFNLVDLLVLAAALLRALLPVRRLDRRRLTLRCPLRRTARQRLQR